MDVDVLVHVLIQHILILHTCLLICLLFWVHMYRRICGSLTPMTAFSIFYLLDGAKKLVCFFIYNCLCACLGAVSFDDACACSRALQALLRLRDYLATCGYRYIGVSLTVQVQEEVDTPRNLPFRLLPHFGPVEIDYFRQIRFVSGQRDVVLVRDHLSEEFAGRILAWNALFITFTSTTLPAISGSHLSSNPDSGEPAETTSCQQPL